MDVWLNVLLWGVPIVVAVVFHEVAHGWVARALGDPTASDAGRLTLNPVAHVDLVGTIAVPLLLVVSGSSFVFGWAKPVPVDFSRLREPRKGMVLVAAAGPLMNVALAIVFAVVLKLLLAVDGSSSIIPAWLRYGLGMVALFGIQINLVLALFNLIPIPPLDGGRVLTGLLPMPWALRLARLEPYGFLIVLMLVATGGIRYVFGPPLTFVLHLLLGTAPNV